jgi:hypothetical protein
MNRQRPKYYPMDEALELGDFLPVSYKTRSQGDYVSFPWDAFQGNHTSGKFEFASFAFHFLYMSFVSFSIRQIRHVREQEVAAYGRFRTRDLVLNTMAALAAARPDAVVAG